MTRFVSFPLSAFIIFWAALGPCLIAGETDRLHVGFDQELKRQGTVVEREGTLFLLRLQDGRELLVILTPYTEAVEKKRNVFRGAKEFQHSAIVPGLRLEVEGRGDLEGRLVARKIRFTQDAAQLALTIDSRMSPVERELGDVRGRLTESEKRAERLTGEVEEVNQAVRQARSMARDAGVSAGRANATAETAVAGVEAANARITDLDDFQVERSLTVFFQAGSYTLSAEMQADLDLFIGAAGRMAGYLVEVQGFASADGGEAYNRRLSQQRASSVLRYLAEQGSVPLRRLIAPYGFGENRPVADNQTREGRQLNRRVEVRLLVSKGLQRGSAWKAAATNGSGALR